MNSGADPTGRGSLRCTPWVNALLEFWFEFASTYSYPAASRLREICAEADVEVVWRPFLLGPVFGRMGWDDSPFNIYPAKGAYMWRDLERVCEDLGLPWRKPSSFPRNGLLAARVVFSNESEPWIGDFVASVYRANFAEDMDISDPEVLGPLVEAAGGRSGEILDRASSQETKDGLRERTDRALELGIFGAPTFVVDRELFWGNDRLEQAVRRASDLHRGAAAASTDARTPS